jgi:hypothetical protein
VKAGTKTRLRSVDALVRAEERLATRRDTALERHLHRAMRAALEHLKEDKDDRLDVALLGELIWWAIARVQGSLTTATKATSSTERAAQAKHQQTLIRDLKRAIDVIDDAKGSGVGGWWSFIPDSAAPSESHRVFSKAIHRKRWLK